MQPDSNQPKGNKRSRAIALNKRGLITLEEGLQETWKAKHAPSRLTRALRAEIFGLSVKTSDRICAAQPVDRGSLVTAFAAVGLEFGQEHTGEPPASPTKDPPERVMAEGRRLGIILMGMILFVLVALGAAAARPRPILIHSPDYRAPELMKSGLADYHAGRYEEARKKYHQALEASREARDSGGLAEAYKALGELAVFDGDYVEAEALYKKVLILLETTGIPGQVPRVQQLLGQTQELQGRTDAARASYLEALKGFTQMPEEYSAAMVQMDLGGLEREAGDYSSAEAWFITCEATLKRLDKKPELAAVAMEIARLERDRGNYALAFDRLNQALAFWTSESHARWQGTIHLEIARVHLAKGEESSARRSAATAEEFYREAGDSIGEKKARSLVAPTPTKSAQVPGR
jgi:tetratricopeptide (TPR) repeat protein